MFSTEICHVEGTLGFPFFAAHKYPDKGYSPAVFLVTGVNGLHMTWKGVCVAKQERELSTAVISAKHSSWEVGQAVTGLSPKDFEVPESVTFTNLNT